jgi:predicted RNA-binding protein with PUA-like domain
VRAAEPVRRLDSDSPPAQAPTSNRSAHLRRGGPGVTMRREMRPRPRRYWLMKSEPEVFSIDDLRRAPGQTTCWDGVRNYQARNFLRDELAVGDGVLYYHSNAEPSGIAGEAVVARAGYPDPTAFDPRDVHYDAKSDPARPTWYAVDVRFVRACRSLITLAHLRRVPALRSMLVLKRGMRLSVQPVTATEWRAIMKLPEWAVPERDNPAGV